MNLDLITGRPGLGTGRVHINTFSFLKIEQFVKHTSHMTWVEPKAIHYANAF